MNAESVTEPDTSAMDTAPETEAEPTATPTEQVATSTPRRLEEEGDVAADYLEELLDIADIDGDIDIEIRAGRTHLSIVSDGDNAPLEALVGRDGADVVPAGLVHAALPAARQSRVASPAVTCDTLELTCPQ